VNVEHPFAQYVRILGKGKSGTRSLDATEAEQAFSMVLRGEVEELQLGAFLMLLRVKEESAEELVGFVQACRRHMPTPTTPLTDSLDWSSYAGKKSQQAWYVLSALLLADNGIRVLMHGSDGHTNDRLYSGEVFQFLGIETANSLEQAETQLQATGLAWLPLAHFCPALERIMQLKPLLGLRSPVNTLARLLNPGRCDYSLQSVFHPAYATLHQQADRLLGQHRALVFKGDGGEVELKPQADTRYSLLRDKHTEEFKWSRQLDNRPEGVAKLDSTVLLETWRGKVQDTYGEHAVIETCAIALLLMERAEDEVAARELAQDFWQNRDRGAL
jgi:anthranilate phosphoribosyltransferase